jgi:hypothetical protein
MSYNTYFNTEKTILTFGFYFNKPIDDFIFPDTLQTVVFGYEFNQNIDNVKFPVSLTMIVYDYCFRQSFSKTPQSILSILRYKHSRYNFITNNKNKLPESIETIDNFFLSNNSGTNFSTYSSLKNLTIDTGYDPPPFKCNATNLVFPKSLKTIKFGTNFNISIDYIKFYNNLHTITFGDRFNQPLENVLFPDSIKRMEFGNNFNQSFNNTLLPKGLQIIKFGKAFNQSLDKVILPNNLQSIIFGEKFNQSLDKVVFPDSINWIAFRNDYDQYLNNLPLGLKKISFAKINKDLTNLPFGLEQIEIEVFHYNSSIDKIKKLPINCEVKKWY